MNVGKVSENILKRSVLKYIGNKKGTATRVDCAFFTGITTDEPAQYCGSHAFFRACNNAAAAGMIAESASVAIILPENLREIKLKTIAKDIADTASKLSVDVIDGHTEVVAGLTYPIVTVTVFAKAKEGWKEKKAESGQYIVMTKWMGMSGGARLADLYEDRLIKRYPSFIIEGAKELAQFYSVASDASVAVKNKATCMNDCSDGGIFAALWQLGDRNGVGLKVNLKDIPVRQETIEICEFFDINPYKLRSDGSLLIVTEKPEDMILSLQKQNINAVVIGQITDGMDRIVVSKEEQRFLEEPRQDEGCMVY